MIYAVWSNGGDGRVGRTFDKDRKGIMDEIQIPGQRKGKSIWTEYYMESAQGREIRNF